jgi:UDPglucose 6-dehydrogenase
LFQKDILNLVYIAKSLGLNEVADYWHQVILMNNHQRERFTKNIIKTLYSTVSGKTIAFLGWAFKKDTNDTRESAAIYVADSLMDEQATVKVYDPKVNASQMQSDLNYLNTRSESENKKYLKTENDPYTAMEGAHGIAVLTEWDEFKTYDWKRIYKNMQKPAFVFDGRNVLDCQILEKIGFIYKGIGS